MIRWGVPLALAGAIWLLPVPSGLSPNAWHYVALFGFVGTFALGRFLLRREVIEP